jgi:hypothetical protein
VPVVTDDLRGEVGQESLAKGFDPVSIYQFNTVWFRVLLAVLFVGFVFFDIFVTVVTFELSFEFFCFIVHLPAP